MMVRQWKWDSSSPLAGFFDERLLLQAGLQRPRHCHLSPHGPGRFDSVCRHGDSRKGGCGRLLPADEPESGSCCRGDQATAHAGDVKEHRWKHRLLQGDLSFTIALNNCSFCTLSLSLYIPLLFFRLSLSFFFFLFLSYSLSPFSCKLFIAFFSLDYLILCILITIASVLSWEGCSETRTIFLYMCCRSKHNAPYSWGGSR